MVDPFSSFVFGLATNLASDLLKAGGGYLAQEALGTREEKALEQVYRDAFAAMLNTAIPEADKDYQAHVADLMRDFIKESANATFLLDLSLSHNHLSLQSLHADFVDHGFDPETLPLNDLLLALIGGLDDAMIRETKRPESPLFNRFVVGRFEAVLSHLKLAAYTPSQHQPSAFISYARADATDFARKLHGDLEKAGIQAWFDQRDMPGGNSFIDEIHRAIEDADYFLLVFTPGAIQSPYCQNEWQRALARFKPIIPILRIGTYADLPREANLYLHDAPDFTTDSDYQTVLNKLVNQLRKRPPSAGKALGVPDLPSNYLTRSLEVEHVRTQITSHKATVLTSVSKRVGVQGMGGIGKSVLAMALAQDYAVRRAFPGGVFWLTFGTDPNLPEIWVRLRQWMGGSSMPFGSETDAADYFEQMTTDRHCLIILDDVWDSDHVGAFKRLGDGSRLLITSRYATVFDELDAYAYELGLLTEEEARQLLTKTAGVDAQNMPEAASGILRICDRLPLALAMIGAMVRGRPTEYWDDALEALSSADLEDIAAKFPEYPYPNLFAAIEVSVQALDNEAMERYYDFAIFPDDVAIPEEVPLTFWKPMNRRVVRKILDDLVQRNLLKREADGSLTIHDLLLAYVRKQVDDLPGRHNHLLNNYNPSRTDWHTCDNDGYLYNYLTHHLREAGDYTALKALFDSSDWLYRRLEEVNFVINGYLRDIAIASEFVYQQVAEDIGNRVFIKDSLKFALIRTSINSLARNYLPELIVQAVKIKYWTEARAIALAAVGHLTRVFTLLLEQNLIDPDRRESLVEIALNTARFHQPSAMNTANEVLVELFPCIPPSFVPQALDIILSAGTIERQRNTIEDILPHLLPQHREYLRQQINVHVETGFQQRFIDLLENPASTQDQGTPYIATSDDQSIDDVIVQNLRRPDVEMYLFQLGAYKGQFNTQQIQILVDHALQTDVNWMPSCLLSIASDLMTQAQIEAVIDYSITLGGWWRDFVEDFAIHFSEEQVRRLLRKLIEGDIDYNRFETLMQLLPFLSYDQCLEVYTFSDRLSNQHQRAQILTKLMVLSEGKIVTVAEAVNVARQIEKQRDRYSVYSMLATYIEDTDLLHPLLQEAATHIDDETKISELLARLLRKIKNPRQDQIDLVFQDIFRLKSSNILNPVAHLLSSQQIQQLLTICIDSNEDKLAQELFPALVPHMEYAETERVLERILRFSDPDKKADYLVLLAIWTSGATQERIIQEALIAIEHMTDMSMYGPVVVALAQHLDPALRDDYMNKHLDHILTVETLLRYRAYSLSHMVPYVPLGRVDEFYMKVIELLKHESFYRGELIGILSPHLPQKWLHAVVETLDIDETSWTWSDIDALITLAESSMRTDAERQEFAYRAYKLALTAKTRAARGKIEALPRVAAFLRDKDRNDAIRTGWEGMMSLTRHHSRIRSILHYQHLNQDIPDYLSVLTNELNSYVFEQLQFAARKDWLDFVKTIEDIFSSGTAEILFDDIVLICRQWEF